MKLCWNLKCFNGSVVNPWFEIIILSFSTMHQDIKDIRYSTSQDSLNRITISLVNTECSFDKHIPSFAKRDSIQLNRNLSFEWLVLESKQCRRIHHLGNFSCFSVCWAGMCLYGTPKIRVQGSSKHEQRGENEKGWLEWVLFYWVASVAIAWK